MGTENGLAEAAQGLERLRRNIESVLRGQSPAVRRLLAAFASGGHVLLEDYPGTGKTTLAKALARSIGARFSRVQFTPDILPSDILGVQVFDQKAVEFRFHEGPIFTDILLADEINRASPRTQSALLEAMGERQVSLDGSCLQLGELFFVIATLSCPVQNFYQTSASLVYSSMPGPVPASRRALLSRRVLTPEGLRDAAVLLDGERIAGVTARGSLPQGLPVEDLGGLVLMPALVDTHVHVNEPGRTEWEGFATATRAAAAGGIATIVDMPLNSIPVTTTAAALAAKLAAASGKLWVDCGFLGGVVPGNAAQLEPLARAGALGFKAFLIHSGIDDFPASGEAELRPAMTVLARLGLPLLAHAEIDCGAPPRGASPRRYSSYLSSRPDQWEVAAVELLIRLCRETRCRVHIVHLSSAEALAPLAEAKAAGLPLTAETCPHYLTLAAEEVPDGATQFKCAPPIRSRANRERLWEALRSGLLDFVVSDHSPCVPGLKRLEEGDFLQAWGGIASLQLALPAVWTEARRRGFGVADLGRWMSRAPASFAGLGGRKGALAPGRDADLVAWDPEAEWVPEPGLIRHRHALTPYLGRRLAGVVRATWLRGRKIEEVPPPRPWGRPILGRRTADLS